jgi:hypothetical protein
MAATANSTLRLMHHLGRAQLNESFRRAALALRIRRPSEIPLGSVPVPDTATASTAVSLIEGMAPPTLVNHSHRTYAFGALLGSRDQAAMLHDLGLTKAVPRNGSFERVSAAAARQFVSDEGWPSHRADLLHRAVAMHMQVGRAVRDRPEVALLHLGAAADVTGMRLEDISPAIVAEVVERYPRIGFKEFFAGRMREQSERHPRSAAALLCRFGQFERRIKHAPFAE